MTYHNTNTTCLGSGHTGSMALSSLPQIETRLCHRRVAAEDCVVRLGDAFLVSNSPLSMTEFPLKPHYLISKDRREIRGAIVFCCYSHLMQISLNCMFWDVLLGTTVVLFTEPHLCTCLLLCTIIASLPWPCLREFWSQACPTLDVRCTYYLL